MLNITVCVLDVISIGMIFMFSYWLKKLTKEGGEPTEVNIKIVENGRLPEYQHEGDVCLDCYSRAETLIKAGTRKLIPLGFALELPEDYEAIIRPRSGNSKNGIDVAIGTIDTNYRGEVMANIINNTAEDIVIEAGDRVCQLAIREAPQIKWKVVTYLSETERAGNGFGSSGNK